MEMKIETIPSCRIAYVRQIGPYGSANVQPMQKIKQWASAKNLLTHSSILVSISHDNPETTPPEQCRYDSGIVIADDYPIDSLVNEAQLIGGKYAIFKVKHTAEHIKQAWGEIFPVLLNDGYQLDARPIYERYIGDMDTNQYCEICVPVL